MTGVVTGVGAPPARPAMLVAADTVEAAARALDVAGAPLAVPVEDAGRWSGPAASSADDAARRLVARRDALVDGALRVAAAVRHAAASTPSAGGLGGPGGTGGTGGCGALDPDVDNALAAVLDATAREPDPTAGAGAPAPGAGAAAVAAWWSALDPARRDALIRDRPELVGGLDGLPAAARDRANRARLLAARQAAETEERTLRTEMMRARWIGDLATIGLHWARVHSRLRRLAAVATSLGAADRALLTFEDDPSTTRAAVASGDVDTAHHVGVFTPGFTAGVADLSDRLDELEAVRASAGPDTAMVAWYGYDAPQWSGVLDPRHSVLGTAAARAGGQRLRGFLDGLDAAPTARRGPAHVTAIGHSYGTVTTAEATAPGGADGVDDVVLLGSPGTGPTPPRSLGHAWVVEAAGDPVADAGWFGPDPNRQAGVTGLSAREVALADGRVLTASRGHGEYLAPGSTSAYDIAAVVGGRPDRAILDRGAGLGDRLRAIAPQR